MGVNISDHLYRKSSIKDMSGNIITLLDEADGGYIVKNRQIVNQDKWDSLVKKEKDRIEAAKAQAMQVENSNAYLRNQTQVVQEGQAIIKDTQVEELEKKVNSMESKLDAILQAINKDK